MLDARSPFQCARFIWNSFSSSSVVSRSPLPSSACLFLLLISFLKIFCHLSPTLAGRVLNPCWRAAVYFITFFCPQHISWLLKELISLHIFFSISDSPYESAKRQPRVSTSLIILLLCSGSESPCTLRCPC